MTVEQFKIIKDLVSKINLDIISIEFLDREFEISLTGKDDTLRITNMDFPPLKQFIEAFKTQCFINIENRLNELSNLESLIIPTPCN